MRDWLAARAAASPRREALICGDERLIFAQLNDLVARECAHWQAAGIRRGQHVAVIMHSRPATVVRLFASMRYGTVLVPLGARLTTMERAAQLEQAACDWLMPEADDEPLWRLAPDGGRKAVYLSDELAPDQIDRLRDGQFQPDVPLAIVHTSGTTGQPKGAILSVSNFFYSALGTTMRLGHLPQDRWLCVMPLWHVGGLALLTRALLQGAPVVLQPEFDPDAVLHELEYEVVSLVSLVPTMLHRLLERRPGNWPDSLRLILLGGAAASSELLRRSAEIDLPVAPTWGLTETTSQVATRLPTAAQGKPGSVGKPLLFNQLRVVSESCETLPHGQIGELLISGPTVMSGYWRDERATALVLHAGELCTGDLGYLDEDGDLFIVQRRSDLIISGGENVYPVEVERVLCSHAAVQDAAVLGIADTEWGQRVAAVVQLQPGGNTSRETLQAYCRTRLAGYKLPREIRFVERLPRTATGKVRRAELAQLLGD